MVQSMLAIDQLIDSDVSMSNLNFLIAPKLWREIQLLTRTRILAGSSIIRSLNHISRRRIYMKF